jgi:hypothetical protein
MGSKWHCALPSLTDLREATQACVLVAALERVTVQEITGDKTAGIGDSPASFDEQERLLLAIHSPDDCIAFLNHACGGHALSLSV